MPYVHFLKDEGSAAMPIDLKYENRAKVLQAFRFGAAATVAEISASTHISRLTVMRAIQFFCNRSVLHSVGLGQSSDVGGKKPEIFAFADERRVLTIAFWPERIRLSLYTLTGVQLAVTSYPSDLHMSLDEVFADMKIRAADFMREQGITSDNLYGVTLSTSGTVDYSTGHLRYSSHSPEWHSNVPISDYLRTIFGDKPVILVENSAKSSGRSVLLSHPEFQGQRVLTLFTSWGISAFQLQRGNPLNGKHALIGEIGHMTIDRSDDELCGCGKRGCLERQVNIARVRRMLKDNPPPASSPLSRLVSECRFVDIFTASAEGDGYARGIVKYLAECFAITLHNVCLSFNPETVVFQGDFGHADKYFDECLRNVLSEFKYYPDEGAFGTVYDPTDLFELDAKGGWYMLNEHYFSTQEIYMD